MPKEVSARSPSLTSQESSYSAVIIADMVAEVQQQRDSIKEEINLRYEKKQDCVEKDANGTNITKGVILNALQFGQIEPKCIAEATLTAKPSKTTSFKEEFNEMSSLRKVAFGFSFLPSIMFVLCFAVIFPCEKILPCVDLKWDIDLNNTEVTSNVLVPENVLFTFSDESGSGLKSVSKKSGDTLWQESLVSPSIYMACGKLSLAEKQSCLIMDKNGTVHLFNPLNGKMIWQLKLNINATALTILPDCNGDGVEEIAAATSNTEIRILSLRNLLISGCDSIPYYLMPWKQQNKTDLIFVCQTGKNETLMRVSQEEWCRSDKNRGTTSISLLTSLYSDVVYKLLPTTESLFLWAEDYVTAFQNNRAVWTQLTHNHSNKNRFIMYGKLKKDIKEVILYSSDLLSNLQITRLNSENGDIIESKTFPHLEMSEAVLINGEEHDFVLTLKKKLSESLKNKAVTQINKVTTSVINILTNQEMNLPSLNTSSKLIEEITLMELDGNDIKIIQSEELTLRKSESCPSRFTVLQNSDQVLQLFVLKQFLEVKAQTISNWDTSSKTASHCVWK